jgi:hypothetical protein
MLNQPTTKTTRSGKLATHLILLTLIIPPTLRNPLIVLTLPTLSTLLQFLLAQLTLVTSLSGIVFDLKCRSDLPVELIEIQTFWSQSYYLHCPN